MQSNSIPFHLGIIMDGNRRWAQKLGKPAYVGHESGSQVIRDIAEHAYERGVKWLTLFAFSTENWSRPKKELDAIMLILRTFLKEKASHIIKNNIRLRQVGDLTGFPEDIIALINDLIDQSRQNDGLNMTIAIGYGGQNDLVLATQKIAQKVESGMLSSGDITAEHVKAHLSTAELPPIDLLLRSGNEQRISNFLLWDLAYAEMVFSPVLWPDFSTDTLDEIFAEYAKRIRRFGGEAAHG